MNTDDRFNTTKKNKGHLGSVSKFSPAIGTQVSINRIPQEIKAIDQWVVHRSKVPHDPRTGKRASSTDPATWASFARAEQTKQSGQWDGLGFVFNEGDDILGIDIDNCVVGGKIVPWAQEIVDSLDSYAELSPSGSGLHVICRGPNLNKGHKVKYQGGEVEIYSSARYFTVTGDHLHGSPTEINDATTAIRSLMLTLGIKDGPAAHSFSIKTAAKVPIELMEFLLTEPDFLALWECNRREENFIKPEGSPDASAYDMALANYGVQAGLGDGVISALIREFRLKHNFTPEKALRPDYIARTITKARSAERSKKVDYSSTPIAGASLSGAENQDITPDALAEALANNEAGDAGLYIMLNRGYRVYDHAERQWYVWGGHSWREDATGEAQAAMQGVVDLYKAEHSRLSKLDREELKESKAKNLQDQIKAFGKWIRQLQTSFRRENVLRLARDGKDSLGISGQEWDNEPNLIACPNGVLKLNSKERKVVFRPGRPNDYIKTAIPTEWPGTFGEYSAEDLRELVVATVFKQFMADIFDGNRELVAYVQRLLGYALSGTANEDVFPILWGKGRNGKTTLLEVLARVLGPLAGPVKSELLLQQDRVQSSAGHNADLMTLRGKRLAWASETEEHRKLSEGRVKLMTGGDTIIARAPYGKREVTWKPTYTMLLLTNKKPRADADDYALWERIALIPFGLSFVDKPQAANERKRIPDLMDQMVPEAPAILAWLLAGWCSYLERGLRPPDAVKQATAQYRSDEDGLGRFIQECCVVGPECRVRAGVFAGAYEQWCKGEGTPAIRGNKLGRLMKSRYDWIKSGGFINYIGIGLLVDTKEEGV